MTLSKRPLPTKRTKARHQVEVIHISSAQIESVCGDRLDRRGNVIEKNRWHGHWLRGLTGGMGQAWRLTQDQIVFGLYEKEGAVDYTSDRGHTFPNGDRLWCQLVQAVSEEHRETVTDLQL